MEGSHLIGVRVAGGGGVLGLRLAHSSLGCPHSRVLGRLLHVWILPCTCGPLFLCFAKTPSTAPVELMNHAEGDEGEDSHDCEHDGGDEHDHS